MKKIAFVCTHNSCRSIIAEGFMRHYRNSVFEVYSGGTEKYPAPKPLAIEVMTDIGIDMAHARSKLVSELPDFIDIIITMGCGVDCPYIPSNHREDWELDDPSGYPKSFFEETRDLIEVKVIELISRIESGEL